jgi:hypothetical protein
MSTEQSLDNPQPQQQQQQAPASITQLYEMLRQDALAKSLAIQAGIAPTTPDMAEVAHKITLLKPTNPSSLLLQIQNSGFSNLMRDMYGAMAMEMEAPERMLAVFPSYAAEKRALFLEYRMLLAEMVCCDQLDVRNPRFFPMTAALKDQVEYQLARTNKDYWTPEREYQAQHLSTSTTRLEEMQRAMPEVARKRGLLSKLNIFGR